MKEMEVLVAPALIPDVEPIPEALGSGEGAPKHSQYLLLQELTFSRLPTPGEINEYNAALQELHQVETPRERAELGLPKFLAQPIPAASSKLNIGSRLGMRD